ncbi:MAG: cell division protein FtsA [Dissulfurispiraceae bacterium]
MEKNKSKRKKRNNRNNIVGLDVGTTKICAIVGEVTDAGFTIHSINSCPSAGLKKGVVVDLEAASESIKKTIEDAEIKSGVRIRDVFVGIAGSHIKSFNNSGVTGIRGKEVTREDVERAIDAASEVHVPLDREVLHVLPNDFILDEQSGIKDPVGMMGARLEVKVYVVTGAITSVQNLLKCCEKAGLEVLDIVLQPLASAEATLTPSEREMGIALVDIGGGTTDIAIYQDGWLRRTAVLGIGGNHFTNDISVALRLPFYEAERVKKDFGSVLPCEMNDMTEFDAAAVDGQIRSIPKKYLHEILQPRGEELLELIKQEIEQISNSGTPVLGAVLTGGSSLLSGFDRLAEVVLAMPVKIGSLCPVSGKSRGDSAPGPRINGLSGEFNNPKYATGVGLLLHGAETMIPEQKDIISSDVIGKIIVKMTDWFKKIAYWK